MDLTSLAGPVVSLGFILLGLILEGGHLSSVIQFTAALIVFGGAFGARW
jgi:chemotaxis protein MotA